MGLKNWLSIARASWHAPFPCANEANGNEPKKAKQQTHRINFILTSKILSRLLSPCRQCRSARLRTLIDGLKNDWSARSFMPVEVSVTQRIGGRLASRGSGSDQETTSLPMAPQHSITASTPVSSTPMEDSEGKYRMEASTIDFPLNLRTLPAYRY